MMNYKQLRKEIVEMIGNIKTNFEDAGNSIDEYLDHNINQFGDEYLIQHLRTCGDIPEQYPHDSTAEKLYSKYTDILLAISFNKIGYSARVLKERGDAADVFVNTGNKYNFVADAKAFRLSRTAKNQKDFKVQAMNTWKGDCDYAIVVCPVYQLPTSQSQIYRQTADNNVCILTYSHLVVLLELALRGNTEKARVIIEDVLEKVQLGKASKSAKDYWNLINGVFVDAGNEVAVLLEEENNTLDYILQIEKEISIEFIDDQVDRLKKMSREEAIMELLKMHKFDSKISTISAIEKNKILDLKNDE